MSEWNECQLGILADIQTGPFGSQLKNEQYIIGGTPVITVEHINNFKIKKIDYPSVNEDNRSRLERYSLRAGDIVFTRVGSVDLSAYVELENDGWLFSSRMLRVRINSSKINSRFLSYFFRQERFREYILNISVGATMPSINTQILKDVKVSYPSIQEQKAIASVLSSLDDKIDLLHRQNKTLESMAETLFRHWFVEESNKEWPEVSLNQYVKCTNGVSYKSSELETSNTALVTLKNFARDGSLRTDGFKEFSGKYQDNQKVIENDIVVAHTDLTQDASLIGNPIFVRNVNNYKTLVISMDLVKVELTSNQLTKMFLFYLLKNSDFKDYALSCSNGSSVIHLSKKAIPSYTFRLPPIKKILDFSEKIQWTHDKHNLNLQNIQTLEKLRDTLLPKLMSGEVRVNYTKE